jgi:phenylalanyl-tRNA synthetase alpha chain
LNSNDESGDNVDANLPSNNVNNYIVSLHPIEKKILSLLYDTKEIWLTDKFLLEKSKLSIDQIRRGIEWLKFKKLIVIEDSTEIELSLKKSMENGGGDFLLPERKLVNYIKSGNTKITDIVKSSEFRDNEKEVFAAIRYAKNNGWINIQNNNILLLPQADTLSQEELLINKILKKNMILFSDLTNSEISLFDALKKRPNILTIRKIVNKKYKISDLGILVCQKLLLKNNYQNNTSTNGKILESKITPELLVNGKWRNLNISQIDVEAPLPFLNYGKKNPLIDFIDEVKEILIGMGFSEIEGNLSQSSFWNFDALFIPQDHSARDMQDTFYLFSQNNLVSSLPSDNVIKNVSNTHERYWGYKWNISESKPYVLRTHTTPVTIQYLASEKPEKDKVFLIGRVFRNEKASFKHLVEFHQVEGIFTSHDANLRQLMGIQTEFYNKLGIKKVKFWPTFFPYTEPSIQSMIYNDKVDKWIELFGMGIFRPEVTLPLGIKNPVLAWGGGFERLAMLRFDLDDIRDLYSNNLSWLKSVPKCLL